MAYEQRENTGSVFVNDKRESEKHPNVKGSALIDGKEYWMDGWTKTTADGKKWQSFSFKPKDTAKGGQSKPSKATPAAFDDDSSIPF